MAHVQYQTSVPWDSTLADLGYTSDGYVESAVKTTTGAPTATAGKFIPAAQILNKVSGITYTNTGSTASPTWTALGGGGGGIAIGDAITDADAASILYVDASGNLTQDANFTRDSSGNTLIRAQDVGIQNGTISAQTGLAAISATDETDFSYTRFRTTPTVASGVYFDGTSLQNGFTIGSSGMTLGNLSGGNNTKITIDDVNEHITISNLPAYDDDTAAGVGGLTAGMVYMTTGSGSAPLNAAGILMIKQ